MVAACFLFPLLRRKKHLIWLLPGLVGWSRVYLGKHFPSDVMAGWVLGAAIAGVMLAIVLPKVRRRFPAT
jgi:undecaprenyl-diphosphatase